MEIKRIMTIRGKTVSDLRSISLCKNITMCELIKEALSKYIEDNKERIKDDIKSTKRIPKRPSKFLDESDKANINFNIESDYYKLLKFSARLESKTIAQKVDEILGDYIDQNF